MALKKNQEKVGHLRETSTNPTAKTGRGSGFVANKPKIGHDHATSSNADARKDKRPVPKETQSTIGTKTTPGSADGIGAVGNFGSTEDSPDTIRPA